MLAMPNPSTSPLPERPILVVDDEPDLVELVPPELDPEQRRAVDRFLVGCK
jgi:hypothetical protein